MVPRAAGVSRPADVRATSVVIPSYLKRGDECRAECVGVGLYLALMLTGYRSGKRITANQCRHRLRQGGRRRWNRRPRDNSQRNIVDEEFARKSPVGRGNECDLNLLAGM